MKKLILPLMLLAFVACKKEDDSTNNSTSTTSSTGGNTQIAFTKTNLLGTWNITKIQGYALPADTLMATMNFNRGDATTVFKADDTYTTTSTFGTSNGTFSIIKLNGKDVLITHETGDQPDSQEVQSFTSTKMVFNDKQFEVRSGDDDYSVTYCEK